MIILDDSTITIDLREGITVPLVLGLPDVEAMMAVQYAAIADAARQLAAPSTRIP